VGRSKRVLSLSLQLDFDEAELVIVHVDHVVRDASGTCVRHSGLKLDFAHPAWLLEPQLAGRERHHHVVMGMNVMAGLGPGREAPFGDDHPLGFDLPVAGGLLSLLHGRP
jgi:hypothetical protein